MSGDLLYLQFYSFGLTPCVKMLMDLGDDWVKRVTVQLEDDLHKQVKVWAAQNEVSMNDVFVEAIKAYIERNGEIPGELPLDS